MPRRNRTRDEVATRLDYLFLIGLALIVFTIYALTAHRTITWWLGSSYPLAAVTLGVHYPPGSLLLTILGWLVVQLPLGISKAFSLNLLASALAAFACCMTMWLAVRLIRQGRTAESADRDNVSTIMTLVGVALACLALAVGETTWRYAVVFMPYILSAVFTAIILWAILNWWKESGSGNDHRWLVLIMLLFGLDLSVHRTNLLLMPGFLVWVLLCRPKTLGRLRSWIAGATGLMAGLAFHLLTLPIAARDPFLNANDPSSWPRFYDYLSLQQYGGGWLVNVWPRKAPFLQVQLADYLKIFSNNFASYGGVLALVPPLFGLFGLATLWRQDRRLTIGLTLLFVFSSLGAVVYFNLPEGFFYPMDRHYLTSFVIFALLFAYGAGAALGHALRAPHRFRAVALPVVLSLVIAVPVKQLLRNYRHLDGSNSYFAYDYANNILRTLQPDAILFVAGDDYSPLSYLQTAEKVRPDVAVLSTSLTNADWYVKQIVSRTPGVPLTLSQEELMAINPKEWPDTTIATLVAGEPASYQLTDGTALSGTFDLHVPPTIADRFLLAQDWLLVKMIEENQWRRPIYFTSPPKWLSRHTRLEGLVSRLIPQDSVSLNPELLRENLLGRYSYRGYSDSSVPMDRVSARTGQRLARAFHSLATYELDRGNTAAYAQVKQALGERIPIDRIAPTLELRQLFEGFYPSE